MGRAERLWRRLQRTTTGWRFEELEAVAKHFGISVMTAPGGSSHRTFIPPRGFPLTGPYRTGEVLPVYPSKLRQMIREILDEQQG